MNKKRISVIFASISVCIPVCAVILILNITMKFLPFIRLSTSTYFGFAYVCLVGLILAIVSLLKEKNKLAYVGLGLNLLLIVFQFMFVIIGVRYLIH
jgi:hypothetical protein